LARSKGNPGQDFPQHYRHLCHQLALAKHRRYSPQLVSRLNRLVLQSHHRLYQHNIRYRYQLLRFVVWGFPAALRNNVRYVGCAMMLFALPLLIMGWSCYVNEELIFSVMSPANVRQVEALYDPSAKAIGRQRQSDTDLMMFGFYIKNNIGISFRTFAGGMLFGAGSIFFLIYNGLFIGSIAGHLTQIGSASTFYPFVIGHGSFELTAIVFSGAAGLKLGFALLAPGSYRRLDALRVAAREAVQIVYGALLMLVIAAFLEAFWSSSSTLPNAIKYSVGVALWCFVVGYCFFAGKVYGSQSDHG
jgi:uncharacterized membrane protein SpoIIM required for sporulation